MFFWVVEIRLLRHHLFSPNFLNLLLKVSGNADWVFLVGQGSCQHLCRRELHFPGDMRELMGLRSWVNLLVFWSVMAHRRPLEVALRVDYSISACSWKLVFERKLLIFVKNVLVFVTNWLTHDVLNLLSSTSSIAPLPLALPLFCWWDNFLTCLYFNLRFHLVNMAFEPEGVSIYLDISAWNLHLLQSWLFDMPDQPLHTTVVV